MIFSSVPRLPALSFRINLSNTPSHISMDFLWVYFSPKCLFNFCQTLYYTMLWGNFQIYDVKITGKCIFDSKYWIYSLLLMFSSNTAPRFLSSPPPPPPTSPPPSWGKLSISPKRHFLKIYFPPSTKGEVEETMELNKWSKLKLAYWPRHLCTLHFFGFCFVVP